MTTKQYTAGPYSGEYFGGALTAFLRGLSSSDTLVAEILAMHELETIDPDQWYDLELARSIYYEVGRRIGPRSLYNVGAEILTSAVFPPGVDSPEALLSSIDAAYRLNARGTNLGEIVAEVQEDSARMIFTTPFPCDLDRGICAGACLHFGFTPLVEHRQGSCRDQDGQVCEYQVSW